MRKHVKELVLSLLVIILAVLTTTYFYKETATNENNTTINTNIKSPKINKIEELKKKYDNNDIVGNISIDGTGIDEAILQSTDNDYYLSHDNYGNYDKYGSVFLDYRCTKDSKKLLIFGHSSIKIDTPFNNLENYYKKEYYLDHKYINLIIDNEERKYLIFSVYIEPKDFTYMNLNITDETYNKDLLKYKNKSLYNTNVDINNDDNILILQTCSNHPNYQKYENKYLLIIAKKIS